jgi:hypothetical protein
MEIRKVSELGYISVFGGENLINSYSVVSFGRTTGVRISSYISNLKKEIKSTFVTLWVLYKELGHWTNSN